MNATSAVIQMKTGETVRICNGSGKVFYLPVTNSSQKRRRHLHRIYPAVVLTLLVFLTLSLWQAHQLDRLVKQADAASPQINELRIAQAAITEEYENFMSAVHS